MNLQSAIHDRAVRLVLCVALFPPLVQGCGTQPTGPKRFQLNGKVTVNGEPIPAGTIELTPDTSKGNQGPWTLLTVRDGAYSTEASNGVLGGPYKARIEVFDGKPTDPSQELGTPMGHPHSIDVELPKENGTYDFVITK